jgi:hypothetical protein
MILACDGKKYIIICPSMEKNVPGLVYTHKSMSDYVGNRVPFCPSPVREAGNPLNMYKLFSFNTISISPL